MKKRIFFLSLIAAASLFGIPRAIVFDFGGVMTSQINLESVDSFIRQSFHLSEEEFAKASQIKERTKRRHRTDLAFWLSYAKSKHIQLPLDWAVSYKMAMKNSITLNSSMYMLVDQLKKESIITGLLSNIDEQTAELFRDFGFYESFDPCLLSYAIGAEKPESRAYITLLRTLNLAPDQVLYIDDSLANIDSAKNLGLDTILFESESQLRSALSERGVLEHP